MAVQTFRDSIAWQKAMDLSVMVYGVTSQFPKEEMFGLTSQLRRASVSVASNIAEGQGRLSSGEFLQFLGMARGSALEIETQMELSRRLGFGVTSDVDSAQASATEVVRILNAVITNMRVKAQRSKK